MVNLLEICIFAPLFRKSITESRCNFNGYIISSNFSFWRSSPVWYSDKMIFGFSIFHLVSRCCLEMIFCDSEIDLGVETV